MFGLFNGLFGEGLMADATEMALEMCLLDEMENDLYKSENDWQLFDHEDEDYD